MRSPSFHFNSNVCYLIVLLRSIHHHVFLYYFYNLSRIRIRQKSIHNSKKIKTKISAIKYAISIDLSSVYEFILCYFKRCFSLLCWLFKRWSILYFHVKYLTEKWLFFASFVAFIYFLGGNVYNDINKVRSRVLKHLEIYEIFIAFIRWS